MKTIAKITSIVLIVVGILTMIVAIIAGIAISLRIGHLPRLGTAFPRGFIGLIIGISVLVHGLTVAGFGEMLYLLVGIAEHKSA